MKKHKINYQICLLVFIIICIFSISIGYSSLNTDLSISGDAHVRVDEECRITNITMASASNDGYETYNPKYSKNSINSFVTLPNINSTLTYNVTIINKSNKKYLVDNIKQESYSNHNINYSITGIEKEDVINENETLTFTITFNYISENLPEDVTASLSLLFDFIELNGELSPNPPVLASNMIPVYYDSTVKEWKKADNENTNSEYLWYDYFNKMWANVVTVNETNRNTYLNAPLGTIIPMNDINTMLVWIPRFKATTPYEYNGETKESPGPIHISFTRKGMKSLEAFNFDGQSLAGFWIAKFENSATNLPTEINNTPRDIIIKPNVKAWVYSNISTYFQSARNMTNINNIYGFDVTVDTTLDTHLIKNTEWGAVAYLTQSKFGKCTNGICTVVYPNNCKSMLTGFSANIPNDYQAAATCTSANNSYNGSQGVYASTTGNVYGVYDMRGGINEYVMGVYSDRTSESGFTSMPEHKYYTLYTTLSYHGHALNEIARYYND